MAFIRNDILDISLGQVHGDVAASLSQLRQRELETFASFPDVLVFRLDELEDAALNSATRYSKLLVRLEHLQNLFFIQRLYAKHGQSDRSELLTVSYEMVSLTIHFWTHRDWFRGILGDYEWLADLGSPGKPPPKRSQIIQQLSLLVGFLEWIRPSAPNSELCQTVARIIRHILDQTLEGLPRGVGGPDEAAASLVDWNTVDFATDVSNYFNFDLLDTFDWL
ncbi:hypothetical protein PG994_001851 [Apiospora phragmitis]|uniref:Uncharacterized protein n=1 Tax=Apiospora phragmitis TaxID=2905665 RepID=A0ABR1WUU0_9PEZI